LDALLPAVLGDAAAPADAAAALGLARVCYHATRYAACARLSATAMDAAPEAAGDARTGIRFNAARAAALAAAGRGTDAGGLGDAGRARLRGQALAWLRADLAWWSGAAQSGNPDALAAVRGALSYWRDGPDLAGVRDADALDKLPDAERADWRKLWADVDAVLQKADPQK
jgi:hypothetical protein